MSLVFFLIMSKVKSAILKVGSKLKEQNRVSKIVCFFIGFFFNLLGIICVAIWKYIFCNNSEKTKYCTRASMLGMLTNLIVCCKIFSFIMFHPFNKKDLKPVKYPVNITDNSVFFEDFFDREMMRMNKIIENQYRMFDKAFLEQEKEFEKYQKQNSGKKEDKNIRKEIRNDKNGYQETIIEKTSPNSYEKIIKKEYIGNKKENKQQKDSKSKNNKNIQNSKKSNNK